MAESSFRNKSVCGVIIMVTLAFSLLTPFPAISEFDNTNILIEEAVNHIYQKRYKQAHDVLKRAYEQSPRHPGVHFNLGRLFELSGNPQEAVKEYQMASVLDPSMIAARRGLARCGVELKRLKRGEELEVVDAAAAEIQARKRRQAGQVNYPQGAQNAPIVYSGTDGYTQKTVSGNRNQVVCLPAMPASSELPSTDNLRVPPLPPEVSQKARAAEKTLTEETAERLLEDNKSEQALATIQPMGESDPDNPRVHFIQAKAFTLKGDLFSAIKHLEEAIRVDEHFYEAYYLLAQNYSKVNLLDDAVKNYLVYFGVKPQAGIAVEIARAYERMGKPDLAREYYSKANAMNPGNTNLQTRLTQTEGDVANNLYLRANHAFTLGDFNGAISLYQQAISAQGLEPTYRRDAERKIEAAKLRVKEAEDLARPAQEGFTATRKNYGTVNLTYPQLANVAFHTKFTGPIMVEWRGYVARTFNRYGQDFLVMIKELSQDELDEMRRDRNDYRLNPNFNNQPLFLISAPRGSFPAFMKEGAFVTFTGSTEWRFYNVINDLGQTVKLPALEFVSAHPTSSTDY